MPKDRKYGQVTLENQRNIGDDEPVFVFRARDMFLLVILRNYRDLCVLGGSPARHLALIDESMAEIEAWQKLHEIHVPRSDPKVVD